MDDVLVQARPRRFPAIHVALFLATVATTLWAGFELSPLAARDATLPNVVRGGLPFAASLVAILFAHEMGHYVVARRHGVVATLPYFIPVPFGAGTLGAVIRMRSAIPSRRAALDIAAAGPIAGLLVAVPAPAVGPRPLGAQRGRARPDRVGARVAVRDDPRAARGAPAPLRRADRPVLRRQHPDRRRAPARHRGPAGRDGPRPPPGRLRGVARPARHDAEPHPARAARRRPRALRARRPARGARGEPDRLRRAPRRGHLPVLELARLVGHHPVRDRAPPPALLLEEPLNPAAPRLRSSRSSCSR